MQLRPYQQEAVDAVWNHIRTRQDNPCIVLPTGCHAKGHPILMYDGTIKKVEDIQVGDLIMGNDSTPRRVLQLARGRERMVKIIPSKGKHFVVNYNHLMPIWISPRHYVKQVKADSDMMKTNKTIGELLDCPIKTWFFRKNENGFFDFVSFSLKEIPEDDFYGFALDGNHLYLDGNFVVHHNTGKSVCIAKIVSDAVQRWHGRILILAHVKELLEQNADKIRKLCPDLKIGIYSAGLKSRDTNENVIVAGIQSVYKRACELDVFDIVIIDEAHLIPQDGEGMYRTFLKEEQVINPNVRLIGLTATPFRLNGGMICKPENLLNHICYEACLKEMIKQGYLSPIIPKAGTGSLNFDNLHIRAGEFIQDEVDELMNKDAIVEQACYEIVQLTQDRKAVLIFGSSISHCKKIKKCIEHYSQMECAIVTGDTPADERAQILERIKGNEVFADLFGNKMPPLKYLVNVNVLTTGFDAPNIDCIAILRPTASAGLLVQMVGRGLRLCSGKENCLVLDYGENIMRHGPLDAIRIEEKEHTKKDMEKPAKKCPQCSGLLETARMTCPYCGYVFPPREIKHDITASEDGLLTGQVSTREEVVQDISYIKWEKKKNDEHKPPTFCIEYQIGFNKFFREWLCPEHTGYARMKFEKWWEEHTTEPLDPIPDSVDEAIQLAITGGLKQPTKITIKHITGEKFDRISHYEYGDFLPETQQYNEIDNSQEQLLGVADEQQVDDIPF